MLFRLATGRVALAACQSSIRWQARSTTWAHVSVASCQSLRFLCFQRLQRTATNRWPSSCESWCNNSKIASTAEFFSRNTSWTTFQRPILHQTCTVKGHSKQICARSSCRPPQLTQLVGHWTPLSWSRTRVGKHPRYIRQIKLDV
jgi:hypothetical protein